MSEPAGRVWLEQDGEEMWLHMTTSTGKEASMYLGARRAEDKLTRLWRIMAELAAAKVGRPPDAAGDGTVPARAAGRVVQGDATEELFDEVNFGQPRWYWDHDQVVQVIRESSGALSCTLPGDRDGELPTGPRCLTREEVEALQADNERLRKEVQALQNKMAFWHLAHARMLRSEP
jgi:hypothetical protein